MIKVIFVGVIDNCSMCPYVGFPFIPFFFFRKLYMFQISHLVSEKGALHNRQMWPKAQRAAKLTNYTDVELFCLLPVVLSSLLPVRYYSAPIIYLVLNCPPIVPIFPRSCYYSVYFLYLNCLPFSLCVFECFLLCSSCFTLCVSSLWSLAVFWIPKCSACRPGGEW